MSRSPRDDWKHAAASRPGRPGAAAKPQRRSRLVYAVVPLLIAVGAAVGLFFYLRAEPKPLFLSLCVSEYDAWPVNAWAQQDGEALKQHFPDGNLAFQSQQEADGLMRELDRLAEKAGKERGRAAVIHVCALAAVDAEGVAILPAKAVPGSPATWLSLSRTIDAVGKVGGHRLLILDLRPVADPRLGQRGDELAKALHAQLAKAEADGKLPFLVLAHCAPAEYPYVSPELQRGMLAEFLRRGLAGQADGWNESKTTDKQVSALELLAYTRGRMAQWLNKHQAPAILPVVYGKGDDFVLLTPQRGSSEDPQPETLAPSAKVGEMWAKLDLWRFEGAAHKTPRTLRQLETTVTRADRLWSGGGKGDVVESDLTTRVGKLEAQRAALQLQPFPIASVGRARRVGIAKEAEVATALQPYLDVLKQPGKVDELRAKLLPLWAKPPEATPYEASVSIALAAIVTGNDLTVDQLKLHLELLRGLKPTPTHLEISTLAFFTDSDVKYRKLWPGGAPKVSLGAAIAAEGAVAIEGRALKRIESALIVADAEFRQALLTLFMPSEAAWGQAVKALAKLPARYEEIGLLGAAQEKAVFEWEETVALLSAVGGFAPADRVARQATDVAWSDLVTKTTRLRQAIDGTADVGSLGRLTDDVRFQRKELERLLRDVPDGAGAVDVRARLRLPVWSAPERAVLATRANAAALDLAKQAIGEEVTVAVADLRARPSEDANASEAADRHAGRATNLIGLAGQPPPEGGALRAALVDGLVTKYRKETDPVVRERFAWLIHPDDLPATPETPDGPRNDPTADARKNGELAIARWIADKRLRPLADAFSAQSDEAAKALARDLNEAVRKLNAWRP